MLPRETFLSVVEHSPLLALDFIVEHPVDKGKYLIGRRTNPPANGFYFVPGGRVRKNETLGAAIARISGAELGVELGRDDVAFTGIYEHIYPESPLPEGKLGTHYCVCGLFVRKALDVSLIERTLGASSGQHSDYLWLTVEEMAARDEVHENAKAYFRNVSDIMWFRSNEFKWGA